MRMYPLSMNAGFGKLAVIRIYQAALSLYPRNFRDRFCGEMVEVFEDALDESSQMGWPAVLLFLGRELIETPTAILVQRLAPKKQSYLAYLDVILAYSLGFGVLGLFGFLLETGPQGGSLFILARLLHESVVGGLCGLALAIILRVHSKGRFALCGAVLCGLVSVFPGLTAGCIFYLLIGLFLWNRRGLLRLAGYGSLALFIAFWVNRISAALVQSYIYHSPTQVLSQTGLAMIVIPYLFEGIFMGVLFGGIAAKSVTVRA